MTLTDEQKELGFEYRDERVKRYVCSQSDLLVVDVYNSRTHPGTWWVCLCDYECSVHVQRPFHTPEAAMSAATVLARAIRKIDQMVEGGGA